MDDSQADEEVENQPAQAEQPSQGEQARETVDDWAYLAAVPRLTRPV